MTGPVLPPLPPPPAVGTDGRGAPAPGPFDGEVSGPAWPPPVPRSAAAPPRGTTAGGKLHPAAIALAPRKQLGGLAAVAVGAVLAPGPPLPVPFLVLAVLATVAASYVRWLRLRWSVADGALVVEQGLLQRQRRVLPLERIQAVEVVRTLPHRVLGVAALRVEAVGAATAEASLDALAVADAHRLRSVLLRRPAAVEGDGRVAGAGGRAQDEAAPSGVVLAALRPRALVVAGLTGGRVGVAAALLGAAQQLLGERVEVVVEAVPLLGWQLGLALAVATVLVVFGLSVVATVTAWWGFELRRDGAVLTVSRGLLEQRLDTVPLGRLQALEVRENPLRRMLGLAAVRAVVAGRTGGDAASQTSLLLPLARRAEALALVEEVLGVPGLATPAIASMPVAARGLRVGRGLTAALVFGAGAAAAAALRGWSAGRALAAAVVVGTGALAVLVPLAVAAYRGLGHGELAGVLVARSGALGRRTAFVPVGRLQSLELSASPFQRRRGLASLALQIPTSGGAATPRWVDADAAWAAGRLRELAARVASGSG